MMLKALSALLVLSSLVSAAERTVSPKEVASAAAAAKAGDTIAIADGDYKDAVINFKAKGTEDKPITLRAQTPGMVKFEGDYQLVIDGEHLVVSGLLFGESKSEKDVIEIHGIENRVTDCAIIALDRGGKWIHFMGRAQHCRLDHCYIEGHAPKDVRLQVEVDEKTPPEHRIDHNHFAHRPPLGENGGETMRIGYSYQSMFVSRTTVEDNLFTQCDGELEIISSKSCENVYRHNTFRDCEGTLTLRHGNRCVVDGNFFFGNGGEGKKTGGVRVIGEDHKITNNYFEKTAGIAGGVIAMTVGIPNSELKGYWQIKKCLIANNVFVENDATCILLDAGLNERGRVLLPEDVTIEKNTFVAPKQNAKPFVRGKEGVRFKWSGNVGSGAARGDAPAGGFKIVDHVDAPKMGKPIDESEVGPSWKMKEKTSSATPQDQVVLAAAAEDQTISLDANPKLKVTYEPAAKSLAVRGENGAEAKATLCPQVVNGKNLNVGRVTDGIEITSSGGSERVWVEADQPFVFTRAKLRNESASDEQAIHDYIPITFALATQDLRWFGSDGLAKEGDAKASYVFLAGVKGGGSNAGVVAGWVTHNRASGIVSGKSGEIAAKSEYGKLLILPGEEADGETFAFGFFDDARDGLEALADVTAQANDIHLPPPMCGYSTWYHAHASDQDRMAKLAAFCKEQRLGEYGLNFLQIDDGWQVARRDFTTHKPAGPYRDGMKKTADAINSNGFIAGLWLTPFGWNSKEGPLVAHQDWFVHRKDGSVYDVKWAGDCLDMSHPQAREFLSGVITKMTHEWGYKLLKIDGLWSGMACSILYPSPAYRDDGLGDAVFHDPHKTNVEVYRDGLKLVREAAGKDTFILGCNIAQNIRTMGASIGLVDAMRVGPDIKASWDAVVRCVRPASILYFWNGRVWHNDPDCIMLRDPLTLDNARAWASWVALSGQLNLVSEWLPDLPKEKFDAYKRTLPNHRGRARPVDLFERDIPRVWQLTAGEGEDRRDIVGLFNWNANAKQASATTQPAIKLPTGPATVKLDPAQLGLPADADLVGFDYWANEFVPAFKGPREFELPPGSCKILALAKKTTHPQVVGSSRHISQNLVDLTYVRWDHAGRKLTGRSKVVGGEPYEIRIDPAGAKAAGVDVDKAAGAQASLHQDEHGLRVTINSPASGEIEWTVRF